MAFSFSSGLREYFAANIALTSDSPATIIEPRSSDIASSPAEFEESDINEEFYDAIADGETLEDEDSDNDDVEVPKVVLDNRIFKSIILPNAYRECPLLSVWKIEAEECVMGHCKFDSEKK